MIYNDWHKNRINGLNKRLAAYTLVVQDILEDLNKEACRIAGRTSYGVDSDKPFTFDDYPQTKAAVERLKQQYVSDLRTFITSNTAKEWRNSNVVQDLLINKVYSECNAKIDGVKRKHLYQTNPEALKAFQTRRINQQGTLSTTLWNQSNDYLDELEKTIGTAIKKGTSAITLSKQVSKYLADFSKLKADYKQMYGKADDIHDCEWRAARLARSEINMAYRTAEQTRWQQMDFVLGYEIRLSKTHGAEDADICDDLAGRYPKDFVWTGWHPNDKCYSVPILMDEDDFVRWNNGEPVNAKPIDDVPQAFKDWVKGNAADIQKKTKDGGSLPYFVKDNKALIQNLMPKTIKTNPTAVPLAVTKQNSTSDFANKVLSSDKPLNETQLSLKQIDGLLAVKPDVTTEKIFSRNGEYSQKRQALHNKIVNEYVEGYDTKSDTVYMLGGAPANGKSTLVDSGLLPHPKGSCVVDSDKVKGMLPEYNQMLGSGNPKVIKAAANFVHKESSQLNKQIQAKAFSKDLAVVVDGVNDGSYADVAKNVARIKEQTNGKRIRADYVSLDKDLSIKLAKDRAEKTGRHVPIEYIEKMNREVSRLIPDLIKKPIFDELYLWDTNENGNPRMILKMIDGKVTIADKELYKRFLMKAY